MRKQIIYFMIDDLVFEVDKPEISFNQIRTTQIKSENEEDKKPRKRQNEGTFLHKTKRDSNL